MGQSNSRIHMCINKEEEGLSNTEMILVFAYNLEFEVRRSAETVKNIDYSVSFWGPIYSLE